jgi:hypothetical protein
MKHMEQNDLRDDVSLPHFVARLRRGSQYNARELLVA